MAWLALFLVGCLDPGGRNPDLEADTDTDVDADTDADTDTDVDGPRIDVPDTLDFGTVMAGCQQTQPLRIDNPGNADLQVTDVLGSGPFFAVGQVVHTVAPGGFTEVGLRFSPVQQGDFTGTVTVISNAGEADVAVNGTGGPDGLVEDVFVQSSNTTADVLLVVDNSCSMTEEQQLLNDNAGDLLVELDALGADYQIAVITTDLDDPAHQGKFVGPMVTNSTPNRLQVLRGQIDQGVNGSGTERSRDAIGLALSPNLLGTTNAGFLRPGAQVTTILLSDEDDTASVIPVADFITEYEALQGDPALTSFTGIAGPASGADCNNFGTGVSAAAAPNVHEAATGTGSGMFDICAANWDFHIVGLAHISTGHELVFELSGTPVDPSAIEVRVDGVVAPQSALNGWAYSQGLVVLLGDWIPGDGEEVRISYEPVGGGCP